jgi:hypothetical protein
MGLSKKSRSGISARRFDDALSRIPRLLPNDLQSLGVAATDATQIASSLSDALRTYTLAHLSDMAVASAWREGERLTRRKPGGLTPEETLQRARHLKHKKGTARARHSGDAHMPALIESALLAYMTAFGGAPTISKEYQAGAGGPAARFVREVLHRYATRLNTVAPEIAVRLRPSPAAVVKRIAASTLYRDTAPLRDDKRAGRDDLIR